MHLDFERDLTFYCEYEDLKIEQSLSEIKKNFLYRFDSSTNFHLVYFPENRNIQDAIIFFRKKKKGIKTYLISSKVVFNFSNNINLEDATRIIEQKFGRGYKDGGNIYFKNSKVKLMITDLGTAKTHKVIFIMEKIPKV